MFTYVGNIKLDEQALHDGQSTSKEQWSKVVSHMVIITGQTSLTRQAINYICVYYRNETVCIAFKSGQTSCTG